MMSSEDREILYPLVINQLLHDGYGVFALSLKKILIPNCETVASNKLLKLVKLGLAVSKYLEDSDLSKDFTHIVHAFQPGHPNNSSFFSNSSSSSNNQSIDQSPQQSLQQNGSQGAQFTLGVNQSLKLEPGDHAFNSLHLPLGAYQRQWVQMANRNTINLDGEIHELPGDGSPNKLFECSLCGKVFNRRDKVKRHLSELHHGIKRHQCVTCSRLFSRNDKLVRHIMTVHQGIKAFGCLHCPRRFSRRWEYQRHMQTTHPTLQGRLPLFTASPPQAKSANQQQSASQQVSPVTVVNTTPVSSSSSPTTPAQVSVASPPATATASTTAAVTSSSSRGMFPIFPVFTSPSATPWSSSTPSTANSAGATASAKSAVADPTTATVTATSVESSTPPSAAPPATSNAHGIFPMFPVFSQAQTSSSTSCSLAVAPFAASNNAVFPSPAPAFTPATTPYHSGYTTMTTPTTNAPTQSTCSESTSLTRMLL